MKKIVVGLPVYNGTNYLADAVESILGQTLGDFELFISDNASSDATEDICRDYAKRDGRVLFVRQPHNLGAAGNYNFLVTHSESAYFKWAAHDDILAPTFLEEAVTVLDRRPEIVLASPASTLIDETGKPLAYDPHRGGMIDSTGVCWPQLPEMNDGLSADEASIRFRAVMRKMVMCVEIFGVMRRSALMRTLLQGPFGGADKVLLAQMALLGPFWLGQDVLFYRRCHPGQFSSSPSGSYRAIWFSGRRDTILLHQLRLLAAYWGTVSKTALTPRQRASCIGAIAHRALFRGHQLRRLTGALVGNMEQGR
jgi:glycosyltransferase involved in cell wall biosynthesis